MGQCPENAVAASAAFIETEALRLPPMNAEGKPPPSISDQVHPPRKESFRKEKKKQKAHHQTPEGGWWLRKTPGGVFCSVGEGGVACDYTGFRTRCLRSPPPRCETTVVTLMTLEPLCQTEVSVVCPEGDR